MASLQGHHTIMARSRGSQPDVFGAPFSPVFPFSSPEEQLSPFFFPCHNISLVSSKKASPRFGQWGRIHRFVHNIERYSHMLPDKLLENERFLQFAENLNMWEDPPYIIMFEAASFDMVKNHICNLRYFPGAMGRLAVIALDPGAEKLLALFAPKVPVVTLHFPQDDIPSSLEYRGLVVKQLVYVLRARISHALALEGVNFWMMQQDTVWTKNFAKMPIEEENVEHQLLFDGAGNEQFYDVYTTTMNWHCGATYFVRGGLTSAIFFQNVEHMLRSKPFYPDSAIMTYLCGRSEFKCGVLPRRTVSCFAYFETENKDTPAIIQIDVFSKEPKMALFKKNNLYFVEEDGKCNSEKVRNLRNSMPYAFEEYRKAPEGTQFWRSWYDAIRMTIKWDSYDHHAFLRFFEFLFD